MCVIDQTIAFIGGLDLCFGRWVSDVSPCDRAHPNWICRWDTPQHVLTDDTADTDRSQIWPGSCQNVCSSRRKLQWLSIQERTTATPGYLTFSTWINQRRICTTVQKYRGCPGMFILRCYTESGFLDSIFNRHDVSMQIVGQPVRDLARHFVQRYVDLIHPFLAWILTEFLVEQGGIIYWE